jgi:hypothetical protein
MVGARYTNTLTNNNGDVLRGAIVQLVDYLGNTATLYSDEALTTSIGTSTSSDYNGLVDFYVNDGTYNVLETFGGTTKVLPNVKLYAIDGTAGAGLVGYSRTASYSTSTVGSKLQELPSFRDWPGSTDQAKFQAAASSGTAFIVPPGRVTFSAQIVTSGVSVQMVTMSGVEFYWPASAATAGFSFTFTDLESQVCHIGDATFIADKNGAGTALTLVWPAGSSGYRRLFTAGHLTFKGGSIGSGTGYWNIGIDSTNAWMSQVDQIDFTGKVSGTTPLATAAWKAQGHTTDCKVVIKARYAGAGLLIAGFSESFDMSGSVIVACDYGVDCSGTSGLNTPGFIWIGGHASTYKGAIRSINLLQGKATNLNVYKRTDSTANFVAFDFDSATSDWVVDATVYSLSNSGGGTTTAMKDAGICNTSYLKTALCDTDVNTVAGSYGFKHVIARTDTLRGAVAQGSAKGRVIFEAGASPGGTNNYFDVLTANSATPSIVGYHQWNGACGHWLTANSVATTITDFMFAYVGDEIVVQANDANTTIQHNSGLQLVGGVNKTMASGDTVRLRRISSTAWKQVG